MRQLPIAMLAAVVLAGCQANLAAVVKAAKAPTASAAPKSLPAASGLAAPVKLVRPAAGAKVLAGHVALDPAYVVGLKAGTIISNDGASVLATGRIVSNDGASVISNDGASIISNDGGSLMTGGNSGTLISPNGGAIVAQGGGNVVAPASLIGQDAGGIISNDGASIVSNDGNSIISNDGNSIISNDGNSVISNDGASLVKKTWALLAAAANSHEMRPAAGMAVYVRSLSTHQPIALGQDPAGKPVYAVYTDLKGNYELYLPPELQDNVEVVSFLPGQADQRLHLAQIAPTASTDTPVDEDTSVVVNYLRFGFRQFTTQLMQGDQEKLVATLHLKELVVVPGWEIALKDLTDRVKAAKLDKIADPVRRNRVADRISDIVLGHTRLDIAKPGLSARPKVNPFPPELTEHALALVAEFMRQRRLDMAIRIDQPGERERLEGLAFVKDANQRDKTTYRFQRPSDYGNFLAQAIMGVPGTDPTAVHAALVKFDLQAELPVREGSHEWVQAAFDGLLTQVAYAMFLNATVQDELQALFTAESTQ
ncbi:MAG: hypothetical protein JWM80_4285 [Cyanobacteria bacterium RYN_339]|nr:hypothetical protein [Cyanobacteria bacterium RYN_339]